MRSPSTSLALAIAAALLAGCGSADAPSPASAGDRTQATTRNAAASAEEVAEEARGRVKCPAKIAQPERARGAPVDDVVGVRPGMTYEEAANIVMCSHDLLVVTPARSRGFRIETYGQEVRQGFEAAFAKERVQKSSQDYIREMQENAMARGSNKRIRDVLPGQAKWFVGTMGMPGEERVITAAREEWFETGREPTIDSVVQALTKKYGTPTQSDTSSGRARLRWAYDTRNRLVTETSPLYHQCHGAADPDAGANLSADCGIVIEAALYPLRDNPALAESMQVGVVDQAGGYERLAATEQGLQSAEMARRAEQVDSASRNASAPTL